MQSPDTADRPQSILIIDFGSQVTQLIARRIRETGVYCEVHPFNKAEAAFAAMQPQGVIFSGGPASVTEAGPPEKMMPLGCIAAKAASALLKGCTSQ